MQEVLYVFPFLTVILLVGYLMVKKEHRVLFSSIQDLQNARTESVVRESERQAISEFTLENAIALTYESIQLLYVSQVQISQDTLLFKDSIDFLSRLLKNTPKNMVSEYVGDVDISADGELQAKLDVVIEKIPEIKQITYVQIIVLMRVMLNKQVGMKKALSYIL